MRISDWSSDVCSSDLIKRRVRAEPDVTVKMALGKRERRSVAHQQRKCAVLANGLGNFPDPQIVVIIKGLGRSEEHTSELQSLMRISYAVFCLKKKKTNLNIDTTDTRSIIIYIRLTTYLHTSNH